MKKLFTILMLLSAYSVALFPAEEEKTYKLVSSADEITEGAYLIAAKNGDAWYAMGCQASNNRPAVKVTVSANNMITTPVATAKSETGLPYEITFISQSEGWLLRDNLGSSPDFYLTCGDGNKLYLDSNKTIWEVDFVSDGGDEGLVRLFCTISSLKFYVGMTSTASNFRSSTSSTNTVYLFKETGEADESVDPEPVVVTPPAISLPAGTYQGEQAVALSAADGLSVYYTLDAGASEDAFELYTAPISISSSATLRAYAQDSEGNRSETVSAAYVIEEPAGPDSGLEEPDDPMPGIIEDATTPAVWVRRFYESFDKNGGDGGGDGVWSGMTWGTDLASGGVSTSGTLPAENVDNDGWQIRRGAVRAAGKCIVFKGLRYNSDYYAGELTSPSLGFSGNALLRFKVGTWNTVNEKVGLSLSLPSSGTARFVVDGTESTKYEVPGVLKGQFITAEVLLAHVESTTRISFCTPEERSENATTRTFLDEVEVYELHSAGEQVDWSGEEDALLSGYWTSAELASTLGLAGWNPETGTELDLRGTGAQLAVNFTVDNTGGNPNLLVYADTEIAVINGISIVDGALSDAETVLTDLRDFSLQEDVSGEVLYVRSFSGVDGEAAGGWSVLCLPFTVAKVTNADGEEYIPYSEWIGTQSTNVGFYWLKQVTGGENAINTDAGVIEANVPYLIAFPKYDYEEYPLLQVAENSEFTFAGSGLSATVGVEPADMEQWEYHTNYLTADVSNEYVLNADGSAFELGAEQLSPFRPYVTYKETPAAQNAPKLFSIGADNAPSRLIELVFPDKSVSNLQIEVAGSGVCLTALEKARVMVHTLDGVLLQKFTLSSGESRTVSLQPGIYLINKQKVIIP